MITSFIKKTGLIKTLMIAGFFALFVCKNISSAEQYQVKYTVNGEPVTLQDIQRRSAFLKILKTEKNADEEMITQVLKLQEANRMNLKISEQDIQNTYLAFVQSNNMSVQKMDEFLEKAGVTKSHFKEALRTQMSWNHVIRERTKKRFFSSKAGTTSLQKTQPKAKEYTLQQMIFLVFPKSPALLEKRRKEAEGFRAKFTACENTRNLLKGYKDVTIYDKGKILEFSLPHEWSEDIKALKKAGSTTSVRQTGNGIEFLAVCKIRQVSDDRVTKMLVFEEAKKNSIEESENYLKELRKTAKIVKITPQSRSRKPPPR